MNKFIKQLSFFTLALLTAALISQKSAASASSYTWGFSVGASAELSGTASKDSSKSTGSLASNLSGKNIKILTDSNKDTAINIKGSNLYASNDIHLNTHNLFIDASQDSYEAKQSSKTVSGRVSATMYGGGGGSAGLDYSRSNMKEDSLSHNNAKVYAGHNIYALASNDALIKGANLRADNVLALKVGHDLSLHSLRDSYNYDSKSSSIAAGIGVSGTKTNSDPDNPFDISNNIVRYSNSKLSSINANYSRSKSSTMVKQTVLSSITAKELNIEVGANTDLKGSLIAAGYYDENGNFIDNGKLRLKTDTLTFSNLSNTRYDKSNSLSIGANYAFKDPQQGSESKENDTQAKDSQNAQSKESSTDPKSKISSINYANNRNLSYSMSKSLATIGKGELIVGDKDISSLSKDELASLQSDPNNKALYNSDDLTRLNRDSSKLSKELYSTKLSSNVDASVDMRLFSKGGRNEIKDDYNRASMIGNVGYNILMGDISFDKYFTELGRYNTSYEFDKEFGESFAKAMSDKSLSLAEKKQIQEAYMNAKNYAMGLRTDITAVYLASPNGKNSQVLMGNFNPKNQTITTVFSTDKHNNIKTDFSSFYFVQSHENSHLQDFKDGIYRADIDGNQETRANARATDSLNYFNKALGISSKGNSNIGLYSFSASNSMANKSTLINNLRIFSGLDYSKSRNVDINKLDPESKTNIISRLIETANKIGMDKYNPSDKITYADHGISDKEGITLFSFYNDPPIETAKKLQQEFLKLEKYKNNPNMPIELTVCYIGGSDIQKELSLLEPNREIIAYEGYYATQLVYVPYLNPGSGKVIYRNGKVIYRDGNTNFIDRILIKK
ncbi:hemagglutinin repeat-containing protein [uncultured Campylobacter sp.]|uniref:hemagglutinin repeat-containing protein n=2 Tax=uncultured Campylobacter sp. TaxID=218934 RepID=UPI002605F27B|nr:hemagglutinin repeat-containing protein [uncultured Campylobacter sp.]